MTKGPYLGPKMMNARGLRFMQVSRLVQQRYHQIFWNVFTLGITKYVPHLDKQDKEKDLKVIYFVLKMKIFYKVDQCFPSKFPQKVC